MKNKSLRELYKDYCINQGFEYEEINTINPYDDTTLFCPAGMQKYKKQFKDKSYVDTICNIQSCIRLNDLEELGDGTHLLAFDMMGFFSFHDLAMHSAITFWLDFICDELGLDIDYVTIHPKCRYEEEWEWAYKNRNIPIVYDNDCKWSDGEIGGYCTEFFIDGVEIGNIVNPLSTCIDAGFGYERLLLAYEKKLNEDVDVINHRTNQFGKEHNLVYTANKILESGYLPGPKLQGYVLRKLMRRLFLIGSNWGNEYYQKEIERQNGLIEKYHKIKDKYPDKDAEWWYDTQGVDLTLIN